MKQRNLKLKNPERLNSSYQMLSGDIIRITYLTSNWEPDEYVYTIKSNTGVTYRFTIQKELLNDMVECRLHITDTTYFSMRKPVEFLKDKNEFRDYLIKQFETEIIKNK